MKLARNDVISMDAGHNCNPDRGASGVKVEDVLTKEVVANLKQLFNQGGITVTDCTPYEQSFGSVGQSLRFRVDRANNSGSSLHLCIHFNAGGGHGVETWISGPGGKSEQYARQIVDAIAALGYTNRGVKVSSGLYVPKATNMPCVLVECAFVDSQSDMSRYDVQALAKAIFTAVTQTDAPTIATPVAPVQEAIHGEEKEYDGKDAVVQGDWLYVRDVNGNILPGRRVDIGDQINILDISYSSQLVYIEYPIPGGTFKGYVKNGKWLQYIAKYNATMIMAADVRQTPNGQRIGSVAALEKVTLLSSKDGWANIAYDTDKGSMTKSGYVEASKVQH